MEREVQNPSITSRKKAWEWEGVERQTRSQYFDGDHGVMPWAPESKYCDRLSMPFRVPSHAFFLDAIEGIYNRNTFLSIYLKNILLPLCAIPSWMNTVGIIETGGPKLNGVVCQNCRSRSRCLPDDITTMAANLLTLLRSFVPLWWHLKLVLRLTFLVRSSSCMRSLFPQWSEDTVNILFLKVTQAVQRAKYPAGSCFIATPPLPWPPDSGITIIDDWCRRYHSRENPVVVCHGRWGSEGGRAAKEVWFMCNDQSIIEL